MHQMKRGLSPNITMSPLGKLRIHSLTNLPLIVFRKHFHATFSVLESNSAVMIWNAQS